MLKHTKGPWSVSPDNPKAGEYDIVSDEWFIAGTYGGCDEVNGKANAHLIAAAPDLLEAAQSALELLTCVEMERVKIRGKAADIKALKAAIAKATEDS